MRVFDPSFDAPLTVDGQRALAPATASGALEANLWSGGLNLRHSDPREAALAEWPPSYSLNRNLGPHSDRGAAIFGPSLTSKRRLHSSCC